MKNQDALYRFVTEDEFISRGLALTWLKGSFDDTKLIARPEPIKTVYTKSMCALGILPLVGMEVMVYVDEDEEEVKEWFKAVVCGEYKGRPVIKLDDLNDGTEGYFDVFSLADITPIDARTDSEKCDDLFKIYLKGEQVSTHKSFSQAVKDGDFGDNIKWSK